MVPELALRQPYRQARSVVDALTVSVVVDNSSDMLSTRPAHIASELRVLISAGMQELTGEGLCSAHHGLSLAVTARLGAKERTVLFDAGPDPYALERNVRRMGLACIAHKPGKRPKMGSEGERRASYRNVERHYSSLPLGWLDSRTWTCGDVCFWQHRVQSVLVRG